MDVLARIDLTDKDSQELFSVRAIDVGEVRQTSHGTLVHLPGGPRRVTESRATINAAIQAEFDKLRATVADRLEISDGITAPGAGTGVARIYVDTADGDLKVVFADGTVKTIVVDT